MRVQPVASGMILLDLQAVMGPNVTGILLPKITGPADVHAADAILGCVETELGLPMGSTLLYPILETAGAIRNAYEIATASERVAYMGGAVSRFGDIAGEIGFRWTRSGTETLFIREKVLIDARAAGIRYPISGMWGGANDDLDGLHAWLTELRDIGYFGMMMGNKDHVEIVNAAFTPSPEDVAYWKDLDRLATEAEQDNTQVIYGDANQGEGHVIHIAHVATAPAAHLGAGAGCRVTTRAQEIRANLSHPIIDADGHFVEVAPLLNEEMLTYLEEMGGPEVRDRYALDTGLTDTSTVLAAHPARGRCGMEGDALVVGLGNEEHPRPRDRAPARAPLRAPRRVRHRLHDLVSLDDARLSRSRRRRAHRPPLPRRQPCARQPVRAVPRPHHRGCARPDDRSQAGGRRARVRGARARIQDCGVRRPRPAR